MPIDPLVAHRERHPHGDRGHAWSRCCGTGVNYRLSEVIGALSHALDLTEGQPVGHSQRSCMIGMDLAERLDLEPEVRRDLFYAILLKDAGCSSSAARMCELFATDDRGLKREFSFVDWTNTAEFVRYAARNVAPDASGLARAGQLLRALRSIRREADDLNNARCDRGARLVAMLGFPPATSRGGAGPGRALGRQRPPGRARGRGDPPDLADRLPGPDGRGLHVRGRPRGGLRRGARAARALVRPAHRRRVPGHRPGRPPVDAAWPRTPRPR